MVLRQLNIRLGEDLAEQLKVMAAAEGLSLNQLVVNVLAAAVEGLDSVLPTDQRFAALEERLHRIEEHLGLNP